MDYRTKILWVAATDVWALCRIVYERGDYELAVVLSREVTRLLDRIDYGISDS